MASTTEKLTFKSGISLYAGSRLNEYSIGTVRNRVTIRSESAPAIFGALKAGASHEEIAAALSLSDFELSQILEQLHLCNFFQRQTSAIVISERATKVGDHSKDASFARIKERLSPELTVTRWLPKVIDSGIEKVSARQSAHIEISGNSRAAQHLFSALIASGVIHTQFAPSHRRGYELISELDVTGGYISATDIGQVFTALSANKAKSLSLFPLAHLESAEELPEGLTEKLLKIHFGAVDPVILGLWMSSGQEHLIISEISGGCLTISPIVKPGQTPCSRCCELTIADQSSANLLEGATTRDEIPVAGAIYLAGLIAAEIIRLIDTGNSALSTEAISVDLLDLCNTKHIALAPHPMCGCAWR
jgi:hypothetical protein